MRICVTVWRAGMQRVLQVDETADNAQAQVHYGFRLACRHAACL